ncbi:phosphatidylcholine and lysophosphatidylcholine phospholipase [Linnemannia gamsii]|uniref:Lysophospholipase NTE1 n=1 Tax=Linnemannia gamsii TaxID=64522 RepID=A0A9P6UKA4_9FUNG|nr:phosphatidylcholine and lysophosphatidylcholine phospholipase [Linnemannia gamsii]
MSLLVDNNAPDQFLAAASLLSTVTTAVLSTASAAASAVTTSSSISPLTLAPSATTATTAFASAATSALATAIAAAAAAASAENVVVKASVVEPSLDPMLAHDDNHIQINDQHQDHQQPVTPLGAIRSLFSFSVTLLTFMTMTLPTAVYRLLSWSFTLHLTFTTLLIGIAFVAFLAWAVIRYRVLTKYSRLPKTGQGKHGSSFDLHPDNPFKSPQEEKESLSYPDEFLSAFLSSIKIFGYLEQPVFHELARHLQTRRLPAGDTILQNPDLEKSFYIVVDGCVQVYEQVVKDEDDGHDEDETLDSTSWDDPDNGYQLLNEVKNGGTLSSLFTILSLFTENVKLRHEDEPLKEFKRSDPRSRQNSSNNLHSNNNNNQNTSSNNDGEDPTSPTTQSDQRKKHEGSSSLSPPLFPSGKKKQSAAHGHGLRTKAATHTPTSPLSNPDHMALFEDDGSTPTTDSSDGLDMTPHQSDIHGFEESESPPTSKQDRYHRQQQQQQQQQRPSPTPSSNYKPHKMKRRVIVAKAMVDTTLAVIPAEAFHRLTQKFPQAAAHIVQVILIRFQRVTLLTGHKYLGLTKDLLRMERSINEIGSYGLPPDFFRPRTMEYLKAKFSAVREESDDDDHPIAIRIRNSRKRASRLGAKGTDGRSTSNSPNPMSPVMHSGEHVRHGSGFSALMGDNEEEDSYLRDQVMECLSRSIGLVQSPPSKPNLRPDLKTTGSSDYFSAMFQASLSGSSGFGGYPMRKTGSSTTNSDTASMGMEDLNTSNSSSTVPSVMSEMENDVEIMYFPAGATLVEEGERNAGLFFVIDGVLDVSISPMQQSKQEKKTMDLPTNMFGHHLSSLDLKANLTTSTKPSISIPNTGSIHKKRAHPLFSIQAGGLAGYLSALSGYPSFVTVSAHTNAYVGYLSKAALDRVMERNPTVLLTLAKRLITLVSPIVLHLDYAMEWMQVNASQVLHRQGDDCDSIYIVLNGRLRTILEKEPGKIEILGEFSQGESVGEMEVLMGTPFPSTLHAIRDTEVARMPKSLFNALAQRHPEITIRISRLIAQRASDALKLGSNIKSGGVTPDSAINNSNLRTIGIMPVSSSVPVAEFADRLRSALVGIGSTATLLNHSTVMGLLGKHAFTKIGKLKLDSWLNEQEEQAQIVLYLADGGLTSPWTQTCIRQADCILLIGHGDEDPAVGDYERLLVSMKTTARKELVLLHANRHCAPGSTAAWLKSRVWVHAHHHIQMPYKGPTMLSDQARKKTIMNLKDHLEKFYTNIRHSNSQKSPAFNGNRSDFARLARRLTGQTVGLVLGGGGARGIAHIGVIKALEEAGIPIDIVGGTSMGAFIGGLYARESDNVAIFGRAKMFAGRMAAKWRMVADFTYPVTSWTTGHAFNRGIWKCFSDTQIQDFWLSYYCNTTNITFSRMEMHQAGYAWRYIRASMSLSGFLPPLCDNGHMLVDGGYMDNLPVEFMKSLGANTIFAVDVGSDDDTTLHNYGDSLSGWLVLLNRWNPFSNVYRNIPNLADLQSRLAYVSSVKQLEAAKATPGEFFYFKPPVQDFGTLEFGRFLEICEVGYEYGKEMLEKWKKEGRLGNLLAEKESAKGRRGKRIRRNSI